MNAQLPSDSGSTGREYLFSLTHLGVKLGLENITQLLALRGNPHLRCPVVHVAGTNGKGSVLAFLDAIFRAAGYRTGRFTSPHLIDVSERFLLNGSPVDEDTLERTLLALREAAGFIEHPPTFFEMTTAVAFEVFQYDHVDVALIETGLGGRLDSTNVVAPDCCAITPIDYDHMAYLGDTLAEIAGEKAGILKAGRPAVTGPQPPEAMAVLRAQAEDRGVPLTVFGEDFEGALRGDGTFHYRSESLQLDAIALGLKGRYQAQNGAVAVALAQCLQESFPRLDRGAIAAGLAGARWPGRLEQVLETPRVILDVAHNPAGARELAASLDGPATIVLAISSDKDAIGMLSALRHSANRFFLTAYEGPRAMAVDALQGAAEQAGLSRFVVKDTIGAAIDAALDLAGEHGAIVITGSIFTVGEARAHLMAQHGVGPLIF